MPNKASLRELIYAFLLAASKTCDLSLIKKRDMQNLKAVIQKFVKFARVSFQLSSLKKSKSSRSKVLCKNLQNLQKNTWDGVFFNIVLSLRCAVIYKNRIHSDSIVQ